jgi:thiol-disulfide isomerase/thioredoxin
MPDFTLPDVNGQTVKLSDVCRDNQVVLINFWASWCTPCRMEMPEFEELYRSNKANGFTILAINVDKDRAKADAYLQNKPVSFPILIDKGGELSNRLKIESLPTTILVRHDGKVESVYEGVEPYIRYTVESDLRQKKNGP